MHLSPLKSFTVLLILALPVLTAQAQQPTRFIKCATEQAFLKGGKRPLEVPNVLRDSLRSPSGKFLIHYDATSSDPDSITAFDFVQEAARIADSAYDLEVTQLGYTAPPYSQYDHYDILLLPLVKMGAYGATYPMADIDLGTSPSGLSLSKTYIIADNRFDASIYATKGYDALRITIFHEFFHVIQFGSYGHSSQNSYFQEMSSVWMEMLSTPAVPDWLAPGPLGAGSYLKELSLSWDRSPTGGYGQGIYLKYLDTLYSPSIVREIWTDLSTVTANPITAVSDVLASHGSDFCTTYRDFGVEAFQTGRRIKQGDLLPRAEELPVDSIRYAVLDSGVSQFQSQPLSLNFFARGFGVDTCVVVISRNTDRTIAAGDVRMPIEGQSVVNVDDPAAICDTTFCLTAPVSVATVSPNPLTPNKPGPVYFVVSREARKPTSVLLDIYTVTMVPLRHDTPGAEAYGATYRVSWNTQDDAGRNVPSGEYVYCVTVDGKKSIGKLVIVR